MLKRISNTIELYLITFYPLWISVGRFVPIVETLLTFLFIVVLICERFLKRKTFLKYMAVVLLFVISGSMYPVISKHVNHIKVMIIFLLAMDAVDSDLYQRACAHIEQYEHLISIQLVLVLVANIFFIFLNAGYSEKYGDLWSVNAFQGIYDDPHQAAYHICALLAIILWVARVAFKRYQFFLMLGYTYCTLITGARVPTILALFLSFVFFIDYMPENKGDKRNVFIGVILMLLVLGMTTIFMMRYTTFGVKMLNSLLREDIDSGRSVLRERDILLFKQSNLFYRLFGHGTDAVIQYHGSFMYSATIWSHNDFFQILGGMGTFMLLIYCEGWIKRFREACHESLLSVLMVIVLMATAFFNGLYIHSRMVFVMPLLFLYMRTRKKSYIEEKRSDFEEGL